MEYIITDHAKERYAERIADREGNWDIKQYVACNDGKITEDINKMMEYAQFIAEGKFGKGYSQVKVYVCNTWVILVDISAPKVITLYKVDLNLGEEFNKEYMSKSLEKIKAAIAEYNATVEATKEEIKGYDDFIAANDAEIAELKSTIRSLQDLSDSYKDVARNLKAKNKAAEMAMIKTVEDLITKKNF